MSKIDFEYCGRSNAGENGVIAAAGADFVMVNARPVPFQPKGAQEMAPLGDIFKFAGDDQATFRSSSPGLPFPRDAQHTCDGYRSHQRHQLIAAAGANARSLAPRHVYS
jgi:hypothetical protein